MDMEQEKEVYVLGLRESFGESSLLGVYTSKLKLIEAYQRIMDGNVRYCPFGDEDEPREPFILRFHANEFVGETPDWNDNKLYADETKLEISIEKVQEEVEIYNDGGFQAFCNFNFEGDPKIKVRYIGGSEEEITDAEIFLDTDVIRGDFSDFYVEYVLPVLKAWYDDNKEILRKIWRTKSHIHIPNWVEGE